MKPIFKTFFKSFLQGLVILVPIAVTAYSVYVVFINIDKVIPGLSKISPGIGFLTIIAIITLMGYISDKFFLTRWLLAAFDTLLERIPGIKFIYSSTKEVVGSFVGDKKKFNQPVWVKTQNQPEIWRIGFLTQSELKFKDMSDKAAVYLPHAYAISGWVILVDLEYVKIITDMSPAEAMKFAVSGGVAGSELAIDDILNMNEHSDLKP